MKNIKLTISYDGTNFYGYQKQLKLRTVQETLERALGAIFNQPINTIAAGRTDRYVHAISQVVNFRIDQPILLKPLIFQLKNNLPEDIYLQSIEEVKTEFNARYSAKARSYIFKIKLYKNYSIFNKNYYTFIEDDIDVKVFNDLINPLKGVHNFISFSKKIEKDSTIREILEIKIEKLENDYLFYVKANGFLRGMVRCLLASSLLEYFSKRKKGYLLEKIINPQYNSEKFFASPHGLYLYEIFY